MSTKKLPFKRAWWYWPYIYTLAAIYAVTNIEPSEEHIDRTIDRAIRGPW